MVGRGAGTELGSGDGWYLSHVLESAKLESPWEREGWHSLDLVVTHGQNRASKASNCGGYPKTE